MLVVGSLFHLLTAAVPVSSTCLSMTGSRGVPSSTRAFSLAHLLSLLPRLVEETLVFCVTFRQHAHKEDMMFLNAAARRLAQAFIGTHCFVSFHWLAPPPP